MPGQLQASTDFSEKTRDKNESIRVACVPLASVATTTGRRS